MMRKRIIVPGIVHAMFRHISLMLADRVHEKQIEMRRFSPLITALIVAAGLSGPAAAEDGACYTDWSVAAPIVKKEGLLPVEQLTPKARAELKGDVVKVTLCVKAGSYVFRLVVRGDKGDLKTVTVDAKNPF